MVCSIELVTQPPIFVKYSITASHQAAYYSYRYTDVVAFLHIELQQLKFIRCNGEYYIIYFITLPSLLNIYYTEMCFI
jgi:hypothetical protein